MINNREFSCCVNLHNNSFKDLKLLTLNFTLGIVTCVTQNTIVLSSQIRKFTDVNDL